MKYNAEIVISDHPKELFDCLLSEVSIEDRASTTFKLEKDGVHVVVSCADAVALRAACNSALRMISVFFSAHKSSKGKDDGKDNPKRNAGED
ncbi:MAG: KEOPS complex subunit Pcc1 [Candidatus Woesearchaeota archaeon]